MPHLAQEFKLRNELKLALATTASLVESYNYIRSATLVVVENEFCTFHKRLMLSSAQK